MGKINIYLKCLFIFFNGLFAILGGLLIFGAIMSSVYADQVSSLVWGWLFAISVLGISWLGIYAAFSEKEILLKIFAGFMGVGMIIMLIFGIIVAVTRNKGVSGPHQIYAQPSIKFMFSIIMGVYFGLAIIALLGLLLSLLMIHQVRRHDGSGESSIAMREY